MKNHLLLWNSIAIFFLFNTIFVLVTESSRDIPVEGDDSYVYAWYIKSSFNELNSSKAVTSFLDANTNFTEYPEILQARAEDFSRATTGNLYKGYSLIGKIITFFTSSEIIAVSYLKILFSLLMLISFALYLFKNYTTSVAAFSLIVMALVPFGGQGLNMIVPSNIALIIAISILTFIPAQKNATKNGLLFLNAFTHPTGFLYWLYHAGLIGWDFLLAKKIKSLGKVFLTTFILGTAYILFYKFTAADIFLLQLQESRTVIEAIKYNLQASPSIPFGAHLLVLIFFASLWRVIDTKHRGTILSSHLLLIISSLHVLENYPSELFFRVQIFVVLVNLPIILSLTKACFSSPKKNALPLIAISPFLFYSMIKSPIRYVKGYTSKIDKRIQRHNYTRPKEIVNKLNQRNSENAENSKICFLDAIAYKAYLVESNQLIFPTNAYQLERDKNNCKVLFGLNKKLTHLPQKELEKLFPVETIGSWSIYEIK